MIHGHSIIELTDVNTGETERFEDDNIVTNGLKYYLMPCLNIYKALYRTTVYEELFSGIKLMEECLEESTETTYIPTDVNIVGYAGLEANSADNKRGLFNLAESGVLEDGSGVKLVWDFAQSQSNGTIACIGLTPKICVKVGDEDSEVLPVTPDAVSAPSKTCLEYRRKERMMYTYDIKSSENMVVFGKYELPIWEYGITNQGIREKDEKISITIDGASECIRLYYIGMDLEHYFFLGHTKCDKNQEPYKTFFNLYKINKTTLEVQKNDFVFSESAYPKLCFDNSLYEYSFIRGNYLYIPNNTTEYKAYFKIDLTTYSFIKSIPLIDTMGNQLDCLKVVLRGDDAISEEFSIDKNDIVHSDRVGKSKIRFGALFVKPGFYITDMVSRYGIKVSCVPFLFTVNNLSTPVTKTADKSMKIIYILKEDTGTS